MMMIYIYIHIANLFLFKRLWTVNGQVNYLIDMKHRNANTGTGSWKSMKIHKPLWDLLIQCKDFSYIFDHHYILVLCACCMMPTAMRLHPVHFLISKWLSTTNRSWCLISSTTTRIIILIIIIITFIAIIIAIHSLCRHRLDDPDQL